MNIPFLNLLASYNDIKDEIDDGISSVMNSGQYILGAEVEKFEQAFARYTESVYCTGVANGLDALHLALRSIDIGPGDEVIVPANTFIATWLAVSHVGATPIPVEPDILNYNIDPKKIAKAVTKRTKAIIAVHLYGQPADMDSILDIAKQYKLKIVEDAAQAHGAIYKNRRIGSHGDVVCWSFYPGKNLGAHGDGGAITTNCSEIYNRLMMLRNYGSKERYVHDIVGFNSRLDPIQALILGIKLQYLDKMNARRSKIARRYIEGFRSQSCVLPIEVEESKRVWHLFVIRYADRNSLQQELKVRGVSTLIHYPIPPHLQSAYSNLAIKKGQLPITEKIHDEVLSLPMDPFLSDEGVNYVIDMTIESLKALSH